MTPAGPEPLPEWMVVQLDERIDSRTGLYHLVREGRLGSTLCGMEKRRWLRWPFVVSRPPLQICCRRCMKVATKEVLEGRYAHR